MIVVVFGFAITRDALGARLILLDERQVDGLAAIPETGCVKWVHFKIGDRELERVLHVAGIKL